MAIAKHSDVVVVGAGVFGLAAALACQARGLSVTVLEGARVSAGASGGIVGALSPHVPDQWNPKKAYQFRALSAAEGYWRAIEARAGRPTGFGRVGRILPLVDAEGVARAQDRARAAAEVWAGVATWQVLTGAAQPAWLRPGFAGVVLERLSARLMPHLAVAAMAEALRQGGGALHEGCAVTHIQDGAVGGTWGEARAEAVILAHGVAGLDWLGAHLGRSAGAAVKGQAALLEAPGWAGRPLLYHHGLYVIPHAGGQVAIGSTSEAAFDAPLLVDAQLDALVARARTVCPDLASAPVRATWAGLRPKARRRDPMLGRVPGWHRTYLANGAFKIGFGLAPAVGETLADLVTGVPTDLPESFTPAWHLA